MFVLNQKITYWTTAGSDANSSQTYNTPVTIPARYAEKDGLANDDKGDEQNTKWIVYTNIEIPKRSMVVLGKDTSTTPPNKSRLMVDSKSNSSFTNMIKSVL